MRRESIIWSVLSIKNKIMAKKAAKETTEETVEKTIEQKAEKTTATEQTAQAGHPSRDFHTPLSEQSNG
jgi:hypothetical protein